MIVTAALVWSNENPEDLDRCIRSTAVIADRVVALDGAYRRYPNAMVRSPEEQVVAIRDAASAVGLDCLVLQPDRLWAGQVEKRSFLLATAGLDSDWIAVVDADWVIHGDRQLARRAIESFNTDVIQARFLTPLKEGVRPPHAWHQEMTQGYMWIPQIFRALPSLRVEQYHWWYSAIKDGRKIWIYSSQGSVPSDMIPHPYYVEHLSFFRTEEQIRNSRAFLNDRMKIVAKTNQEDDVPGLDPPVFDFETVPAG